MSDLSKYRDVINFPDFYKVHLDRHKYWPAEGASPEEHKSAMDDFLKQMDPLVKALETEASAIPEYGIVTSAAISLLWGAIQPSTIHLYQEPVQSMVGKIVESKLQSEELSRAHISLKQFNEGYGKDVLTFALPKSDDDAKHTQELADQFKAFVDLNGTLTTAFYTVKDHLPWFNTSAHTLLISTLQSIFDAYKARLLFMQTLAFHARSKDDVNAYNEAQLEVCTLLDSLKKLIPELQESVKTKVEDLKSARLNGLVVNYNWAETHNLTDHRHHKEKKYKTEGWVHDPVSNRRLLKADLIPTTPGGVIKDTAIHIVSEIFFHEDGRGEGAYDDAHFDEIMDVAKQQYKDRLLPAHIDVPFLKLLRGVQKVVRQAQTLDSMRLPGEPQHGPAFIANSFVPAPPETLEGLNDTDTVAYRYTLHDPVDDTVLSCSPWGPYTKHTAEGGKLQQIYVGDGYAAMKTTRKIYRRTSKADWVGVLVGTITGHGILKWPEDVPQESN
jgi:hypothetical protein